MYNFFIKKIDEPISSKCLIENYTNIIKMLIPFTPHIANECLDELLNKRHVNRNLWPSYDKKYLDEENVNIVIQINGKKS